MSTGGLALDKVTKFTLGRKTLILKAKTQAELEVKNGKHVTISRTLREGKAHVTVP